MLKDPLKAWRLTPITPTGHARELVQNLNLKQNQGLKYSKVVWPEVHCSARASTTTPLLGVKPRMGFDSEKLVSSGRNRRSNVLWRVAWFSSDGPAR